MPANEIQFEYEAFKADNSITDLYLSVKSGDLIFASESSYFLLASDLLDCHSYVASVEIFKLVSPTNLIPINFLEKYCIALYFAGHHDESYSLACKILDESSLHKYTILSILSYSSLMTRQSHIALDILINRLYKQYFSPNILIYAYLLCSEDKLLETNLVNIQSTLFDQLLDEDELSITSVLSTAASLNLHQLILDICSKVLLKRNLDLLYHTYIGIYYRKTGQPLKAHISKLRRFSRTKFSGEDEYHEALKRFGRDILNIVETHFENIPNYREFMFPLLDDDESQFLCESARLCHSVELISWDLDKAFVSFISSVFRIKVSQDIVLYKNPYVVHKINAAVNTEDVDNFLESQSELFLSRTFLVSTNEIRNISGDINQQYASRLNSYHALCLERFFGNSKLQSCDLKDLSFEITDLSNSLIDSLSLPQSFYTKINHRFWEYLSLAFDGYASVSFDKIVLPYKELISSGYAKALRDLHILTSSIVNKDISVIPTGFSMHIGQQPFLNDFTDLFSKDHDMSCLAHRRMIAGLDIFSAELKYAQGAKPIFSDTNDFYNLYRSGEIQKLIQERASLATKVFIVKDKSESNPYLIGIDPSKHNHLFISSKNVIKDWMHTLCYTADAILRELFLGNSLVVLVRAGPFSAILGRYIALQCHCLSIKTPILFLDLGNLLTPSNQAFASLNYQFSDYTGFVKHKDCPLTPRIFTYL